MLNLNLLLAKSVFDIFLYYLFSFYLNKDFNFIFYTNKEIFKIKLFIIREWDVRALTSEHKKEIIDLQERIKL